MFNIRVNRDKVFTDEDENCGKLAEPVLQLFVVQHVTTTPFVVVPVFEGVHVEEHEYVLIPMFAVQIVVVFKNKQK